MKLYNHPAAPNPRRVRMFLAEKDLLNQVEIINVDLGKGEHKSSDFLKKNPYAGLPVLELEDGTSISESVSISKYFEDLQPESPLLGETSKDKAVIDMWQRRVEQGVLGPIGTYFHQATDGLGEKNKYRNKEWGEHNLNLLKSSLEIIETQLDKNVYVAGNNFSIADITLLSALDFGLFLKIVDLSAYPSVHNWYKTVSKRPSAAA